MSTVDQITAFLQDFAPLDLAESWDNVGLLLGSARASVHRVMTCLTLTPATAAEAIDAQAQLIVSHHPIFFRGCKRLAADNPEGALLLALTRAGISLYSPHT